MNVREWRNSPSGSGEQQKLWLLQPEKPPQRAENSASRTRRLEVDSVAECVCVCLIGRILSLSPVYSVSLTGVFAPVSAARSWTWRARRPAGAPRLPCSTATAAACRWGAFPRRPEGSLRATPAAGTTATSSSPAAPTWPSTSGPHMWMDRGAGSVSPRVVLSTGPKPCHMIVCVCVCFQVFVCLWKGCKVYNRPSTSQSWLQRHMLTHSGDKPFKVVTPGAGATAAAAAPGSRWSTLVLFVCLCFLLLSVWWEVATLRLRPRGGWPGTSPHTSAPRAPPGSPARAGWRRSLHPRPVWGGGSWRTSTGAPSVRAANTTHTHTHILRSFTHTLNFLPFFSFLMSSPTSWLLWCSDHGCHSPSGNLPQPGNAHREPGQWTQRGVPQHGA